MVVASRNPESVERCINCSRTRVSTFAVLIGSAVSTAAAVKLSSDVLRERLALSFDITATPDIVFNNAVFLQMTCWG